MLGLSSNTLAIHNKDRDERQKARKRRSRRIDRRQRLRAHLGVQQARVDLCYADFLDGRMSYCNPLVGEFCFPNLSRQRCEHARRDFSWWESDSAVHGCFRELFPE